MTVHEPSTNEANHPHGASWQGALELVERSAWLDFFDAAPRPVVDALQLRRGLIGGVGLLACRSIPITELNRGMAVGVDAWVTERDLDNTVDWLDEHAGPGWALQIPPFVSSPVLTDFLGRKALSTAGRGWAKFARSASKPFPVSASQNVRVAAAIESSASLFGETVQTGFGLPKESASWFAALVGRPSWQCFLAFIDGEPAGSAAVFLDRQAAWLGMATTLSIHRGKGVQNSLIGRRIEAALAGGAKFLTCETGQPSFHEEAGFSSFRNQKRHGFSVAYARPNLKSHQGSGDRREKNKAQDLSSI